MYHVDATEVDYVQRSYTRGRHREEKGEYHGRQKIKLEREVFLTVFDYFITSRALRRI